jgi:hypothetical protein
MKPIKRQQFTSFSHFFPWCFIYSSIFSRPYWVICMHLYLQWPGIRKTKNIMLLWKEKLPNRVRRSAVSCNDSKMMHYITWLLRFYPHFSTFLTHVTSRALNFPCHLPRAPSMCLQITGLILTYVALTCIILFSCLVYHGCAAASYYVPLTRSSMTHSSPFQYYTPSPFWYTSWSPYTLQVHHDSSSSEALCFFPWSRTIINFVYCSTFRTQLQTQTLPVYKPLSRRLCLSSLTWSLIRVLFSAPTVLLCVSLVRAPWTSLLRSKGPLCPLAVFPCLNLLLYSFAVSVLGLW